MVRNQLWTTQQAKLEEKDAQIERLKETTTQLQRECAKRGIRIADLERLIIRAGDAMERLDRRVHDELIAELRKAAE